MAKRVPTPIMVVENASHLVVKVIIPMVVLINTFPLATSGIDEGIRGISSAISNDAGRIAYHTLLNIT